MLSHVRVLDVTGGRGEIAGYLLAQHGADVVLVEPPEGSASRRAEPLVGLGEQAAASAWALALGRGKRSVVLDLSAPEGRSRFVELLRSADVLVESWSTAERVALGLTPAETAALNPQLVHATISPFGSDGPRAEWEATDLTVMASASPLAVTGDRDRPPVRMSLPQAFSFGGAAAAGAVLLALYEREASGLGQHVDVSAQQAAALATQTGLLAEAVGAPASVRSAGGASMGRMSLRFLYPAQDGHVSITHVFGEIGGPSTARLMAWVHEAGFCDQAMRDKDWVRYAVLVDTGEEPLEAWEEVKRTVAAFTSSLPKAELLRGAIERRLLMAPVSDLAEVIASPHLQARDFWEQVAVPGGGAAAGGAVAGGHAAGGHGAGGPVAGGHGAGIGVGGHGAGGHGGFRAAGRYARSSAWSPEALPAAPQLGQHTGDVLGEPPRAWAPPAPPAPPPTRALEGLKVLDLTWSVAGPAMTRVLADHGATVVKVESVRRLDASRTFLPSWDNVAGVENSALFDNLNAGKLSLSLNIAAPAGRAVLDDLLRWADVVVDSFSPRGRSAVGLDDGRVRAVNPSIVNMSVTLFGLDGPLAELAGYGNLGAALAGCYDVTGWPDRAPAGPYLAYTDYTSAHLMLVTLMTALLHRRATGAGQFIELSQAETALQFLAPGLLATEVNGESFGRMGNDDLAMAPHGVYPCRGEDRWVAIACQDDERWPALCEVMGRPDLAGDVSLSTSDGRLRQRRRLDEEVAAWTVSREPDEVAVACQAAKVAAYTVQNSAECLADPQLAHRGHVVRLDHPDRGCVVEATRFRLSRTPGRPQRRAPTLGEHTADVLMSLLGYEVDRVADLAAAELLE